MYVSNNPSIESSSVVLIRVTCINERCKKKHKSVSTSLKKSMRLRKSVCRNRSNRSIQNQLKIVPGRCLGDTRGLSGAFRGPVQAGLQTQLKIYKKLKASGRLLGRPGTPQWTQREPKNHLKIYFLVKKNVPSVDSLSIFVHIAVFCDVSAIWHRFSTKILWKINLKARAIFHSSACFFEHGDPHETSYFTIRKLLFHFWGFCISSKKTRTNDSKIQGATVIQKITKDWSPGTHFGTKNRFEFMSERPNIPKIIQRSSFCPGHFRNIFVDTKKPISFGFFASKWGGEIGWTSPEPENRCCRSGTNLRGYLRIWRLY